MIQPSPWITQHSHYIAPKGQVLDLACGNGRHTQYLIEQGFSVTALDIDTSKVENLNCEVIQADLEGGNAWPLRKTFDAIVITNYLHRPLFPEIIGCLNNAGVLIYQTFMLGNEKYGRPSNIQFLLKPNELKEVFAEFELIAFSEGYTDKPKPAMTQQICVRRRSKT